MKKTRPVLNSSRPPKRRHRIKPGSRVPVAAAVRAQTATIPGPESSPAAQTEGSNANVTSPNGANAEQTASPNRPGRAGRNARNAKNAKNANATASPSATASGSTATTAASATPASTPTASVSQQNAGATTTNSTAVGANTANTSVTGAAGAGGRNRRVDQQKVTQVKQQAVQIRQQHASFRAQPRPDRVQSVTFNQNYRINGAERWQGPQYQAFRDYRAERHDRNWYHQHYQRVELIGGGYYYWNNGYWFPAWGYDTSHNYYAYDGPIYVGREVRPPDQVIADVQAELQQMGYYTGEVDGLLGPLTREALTAYQEDEGLTPTAAMDEPTLDSLGMAS